LSLDEAHHRRGRARSDSIAAGSRCSTGAADAASSATCARCPSGINGRSRWSRSTPTTPTARRSGPNCRTRGSSAITSTWSAALDSIRRERQRQHARRRPKGARRSGHAATWRPKLYRARHRLLKASERLTAHDRRRLCALFAEDPLLAEAWGLKETFRAVYRATSRPDAERRLDRFLAAVDRSQLPALEAFAEGIRQWRSELLAYFDEPTTNGYAEGVINKVKVIKRRAYGLPTFTGFRNRVLLACG
jgi:transposase